ncbi:MAG: NADH-quinone oxidoreductase subunit L, partial [Bacteroidales bacterium]
MEVGIATTAFLILFPVLVALILMFVRDDRARSYITVVGALVIACGSIFCAAQFLSPETHLFAVDDATATIIGYIALVIEVALCLYIIIKGIYYRKPLAIALAIIQLGLVFYLDLAVAEHVNVVNELYIDNFSIIMALIIGVVGSGIIVYGLGYMRVHEAHNDGPDRRSSFFSVMFAFLGAMFAIVFCNSLTWMLCAWEVTTVCSFALIGYTRTKEAIDNSFLQIVLNMIGGIAFTIALIWAGSFYGVMELDR